MMWYDIQVKELTLIGRWDGWGVNCQMPALTHRPVYVGKLVYYR